LSFKSSATQRHASFVRSQLELARERVVSPWMMIGVSGARHLDILSSTIGISRLSILARAE
jgi:hypothetical protein